MHKVRDEEFTPWLTDAKTEIGEKKVEKLLLSWDLLCSHKEEFMKEPQDDAQSKGHIHCG